MSPLEKLTRSRNFNTLTPAERLEQMLRFKSFDEMLLAGDILDMTAAIARTGYTRQHLARLCRDGRIEYIGRGVAEKEIQYFFFPGAIKALFNHNHTTAKR